MIWRLHKGFGDAGRIAGGVQTIAARWMFRVKWQEKGVCSTYTRIPTYTKIMGALLEAHPYLH
jgi:hypothetical protein